MHSRLADVGEVPSDSDEITLKRIPREPESFEKRVKSTILFARAITGLRCDESSYGREATCIGRQNQLTESTRGAHKLNSLWARFYNAHNPFNTTFQHNHTALRKAFRRHPKAMAAIQYI